jgi:hypothetical protein
MSKIKITEVSEITEGWKSLYKDESPLPEKVDRIDGCSGYADVEGQFRFWIRTADDGKNPIGENHIIGYGWEGLSKAKEVPVDEGSYNTRLEIPKRELNKLTNALTKLKVIPEFSFYGYSCTQDIALHSDNGSEFCT